MFRLRAQGRGDRRQPDRERDEAYRLLRTNLEVAVAELDRPTIAITSARAGEGKTQTTAELARSLAVAGRRVIAVDLDLRDPNLHSEFGEPGSPGVADVLRDHTSLPEAMRRVTVHGPAGESTLYLLPAGSSAANPPELLGTQRTARLIEALAVQADLILIDTPPVLPVADTLIVGRMVSGVLLVVNSGTTPYSAVIRTKDMLVRNHARLLGMVLNKFDERSSDLQLGYGPPYGSRSDEVSDPEPDPNDRPHPNGAHP